MQKGWSEIDFNSITEEKWKYYKAAAEIDLENQNNITLEKILSL